MDQRTGELGVRPAGTPDRRGSGLRRIGIIVGGLLVIGALVWWALQPAPPQRQGAGGAPFGPGPGAQGPMPVGVAQVAMGDINISLNALGTVTPLATVTVRPQVSGAIIQIPFSEGQTVKKGDLLFEIDPRPYQAALDQAEGALARDQALLANARVDLDRYKMLIMQNAISDQTLATQDALVQQDVAVVKLDQAAVETAKLNVEWCEVRSPVTGRVGLRQVDIGNLVQAGQANDIVVVTQLQPMSVLAPIPEDNIVQVMKRVNAGATLQVSAYDRSQTTLLATGTLGTVDNEIDPTTGTVKLRAMFDNKDNTLFPDQFVNIKLLVDTLHNQIYVPDTAIEQGAVGSFVYVVNSDNTVSMRPVKLGPADGSKQSITSGVNVGETVVVDGAERLRDGAKVLLPGQTPPTGAQGAGQKRGQGQGGQRRRKPGQGGQGQGGQGQGAQGGAGGGAPAAAPAAP